MESDSVGVSYILHTVWNFSLNKDFTETVKEHNVFGLWLLIKKTFFFSILSIPSHKAHTVNIHIICHEARHTVHLAMKMVKILATKEDLLKSISVFIFSRYYCQWFYEAIKRNDNLASIREIAR